MDDAGTCRCSRRGQQLGDRRRLMILGRISGLLVAVRGIFDACWGFGVERFRGDVLRVDRGRVDFVGRIFVSQGELARWNKIWRIWTTTFG